MSTRPLYALLAVGAIVLLAPALIIGAGFIFAIGLVLVFFAVVLGSKLGFEVFKERQSGMSAAKARNRATAGGDDDSSWRDR